MLLSCPECLSGLEVPDGTTALVRCPACQAVFAPNPEEVEDLEESEEASPVEGGDSKHAKKPAEARSGPRTKRGDDGEDESNDEGPTKRNRDFDPITEKDDRKRRRKKRRRIDDSKFTAEEKAEKRAAFQRAASGAMLIWISFVAFMFSMGLILIYYLQSAFMDPMPLLIAGSGVIGLVGWLVAAIGVGLCLSGPEAPGHWTFGIPTAIAVVFHLALLLVLTVQVKESEIVRAGDSPISVRLSALPTRLNATMFYAVTVLYPDNQDLTPKGGRRTLFSALVGVLEMTRTVMILMLLSCLARAALDEDLAHRCTRVAGIVSVGPGVLALLIVSFVVAAIETGNSNGTMVRIMFASVQTAAYAIAIGVMFPAFMAARDVADACNEPFQSLIPQR